MSLHVKAARKSLTTALAIALVLGPTAAFAIGAGAVKPAAPVIQSVATNLKQNTLTITGQHFGSTVPIVSLGGLALKVQSASAQTIVARLPVGIRPATYGITVTAKDGARVAVSDVFHAALF
jgi:hypothetical protein